MFKRGFCVQMSFLTILAVCQKYGSAAEVTCAFLKSLSATVAKKLNDAFKPIIVMAGPVAETFTRMDHDASDFTKPPSCDSGTNELKAVEQMSLRLTAPLTNDKNPERATVGLTLKLAVEKGGKILKLSKAIDDWFSLRNGCKDNDKNSKCNKNFATLEKEIKDDHDIFFIKLVDMLKKENWVEDVNGFKFFDPPSDSQLRKTAAKAEAAIKTQATTLPYNDSDIKKQLNEAVFEEMFAANGLALQIQSKPDASDGFQVKVEVSGRRVAVSENSHRERNLRDLDVRIRDFVKKVL